MAAKEKIKVESLSLHKRLIAALPRILSQNGKVVLGFASFGDIDTLDTILRNPTLKVAVVSENKFDVNWYKIDVELKLADNK